MEHLLWHDFIEFFLYFIFIFSLFQHFFYHNRGLNPTCSPKYSNVLYNILILPMNSQKLTNIYAQYFRWVIKGCVSLTQIANLWSCQLLWISGFHSTSFRIIWVIDYTKKLLKIWSIFNIGSWENTKGNCLAIYNRIQSLDIQDFNLFMFLSQLMSQT